MNADGNLKLEDIYTPHSPKKQKCEVEIFPQRFTKPNVSGYIKSAPARGLLCEPCQEGPADQMILPGTEATEM